MISKQGRIPFTIPGIPSTCHTFYKSVGDITSTPPLIFIHGGPGAGHEYYFHLAAPLLAAGIPTIFYDQIGCGQSSLIKEKAEDEIFWTLDIFCAELDNLIDYLDLRGTGYHLHGQSWGGMLASEFAGRRPRGLKKLVIANSMGKTEVSNMELERLFRALPVSDEVMQMEADEDFDNPTYQEASERFGKKHFCTHDPLPEVLTAKTWESSTPMWPKGRTKNHSCIKKPGLFNHFDATTTAGNIEVPTLLVVGRHDVNNKVVMGPWGECVKRVKWVILEHSGHFPGLEEEERYVEVLKEFLM